MPLPIRPAASRRFTLEGGVMDAVNAGVWIDHSKAVLVFVSKDDAVTATIRSHVPGHPHYAGAQDRGGEQKYEARHTQRLDQFYDDVIAKLDTPASLLVFGPGEAKRELQKRFARRHALRTTSVVVETSDTLTDAQIVAKVKTHAASLH